MNLGTVPDDAIHVVMRVIAENLVHLAVIEGRVQAAGYALGTLAGAAPGQLGDAADR